MQKIQKLKHKFLIVINEERNNRTIILTEKRVKESKRIKKNQKELKRNIKE